AGGKRLSQCARDPRRGAGRHAGGELRHLDDQVRRRSVGLLHAPDRRLPRRSDVRDPGLAGVRALVAPPQRLRHNASRRARRAPRDPTDAPRQRRGLSLQPTGATDYSDDLRAASAADLSATLVAGAFFAATVLAGARTGAFASAAGLSCTGAWASLGSSAGQANAPAPRNASAIDNNFMTCLWYVRGLQPRPDRAPDQGPAQAPAGL